MDGKKYFCECCKDLGINDFDLFRLGNQNTQTKSHLKFKTSYDPERQSQLFAVNYFSTYGIFVAWRTKVGRITRREVFSVKKEDVSHVPSKFILSVPKSVQYSEWDQELVYAFQPDSVKLFLQQYVLPNICKK